MKYLLDTDHCVALLRPHPLVQHRLDALEDEDEIYLSVVAAAELFYGAALTRNPQETISEIRDLFDRVAVLELDLAAAMRYGRVRADLRRRGTLIEDNDLHIANVALSRELTLLTHNREHYTRIEDLRLMDWFAPL